MRIQESNVQLSANHEASRSQTSETTMNTDFRALFKSLAAVPSEGEAAVRQRVEKMLQSLVDAILAAIDGKKCSDDLAAGNDLPAAAASTASSAPAGRAAEITWQRTVCETVSESERTNVCGSGKVKTCDGRAIDFDFSLALSRDYQSTKTSSESGSIALRDPLVLSFSGNSCELTEARLDFDLDSDGKAEQIPGLGAGSCFLVFDRNGNGQADNGSELFGVASGNGFADLAKLDSDHNGWIDEADPVWSQLGLWSGKDYQTLGEGGVGALYTGAVDAPFSLKTRDNELLGQIRAAGVYLSEAGEVGNLQQVDLAVSGASTGKQQPEQGEQLAA